MTEQEKQLLLKDLCARLPYNVKVAIDFKGYLEFLPSDEDLEYTYRKNLNFILDYKKKTIEDISLEPNILYAYPCSERFQMLRGYTYELDYGVPVEFIKPYLRPMSSMTGEENIWADADYSYNKLTYGTDYAIVCYVDYLYSIHVDCHGIIPKGLALEAPEGLY